MRLAGYVTRLGDRRGVLVGKPESKRPLGRPKRRCEDKIKMHFQEVEWGVEGRHGLDLSGSGYGQVAGTCKYGNETSGSIK
jgi:hypothetical protein